MTFPIQLFDAAEDVTVWEGRRLPHWSQPGAVCFATWRTWDSIPRDVLERWRQEREAWLTTLGIDPQAPDWKMQVRNLPHAATISFRMRFAERWDNALDECRGCCPLRSLNCSAIVADSLRHFDGDRYALLDFVVMPNHVRIMAAFPSADAMSSQFKSWKHFTAVRIIRVLQRKGRFWQIEDFDHLVRSEDQFQFLRRYIEENPIRARLTPAEFRHYSKDLTE